MHYVPQHTRLVGSLKYDTKEERHRRLILISIESTWLFVRKCSPCLFLLTWSVLRNERIVEL